MHRWFVVTAVAALLAIGWSMPVLAQDGIYIENNGVDSSDSAAGADNVSISLDAGSSSMTSGAGSGNAERLAVREGRERKDRGARNAAEEGGEAAPVEAAPVEPLPAEEFQAYTDSDVADPAAASEAAQLDPTTVLRLPSTGVGDTPRPSPAPLVAALVALAFTVFGLRRPALAVKAVR